MDKLKILVLLIIVVGLVLVSCAYQETKQETETISPVEIQDAPQTDAKEQEEDVAFDLPSDQDSPGWKQTSGPLGGVVIRMVPHDGTVWASLYSGGIYELQPDDSWKHSFLHQH